MHGFEPSASAIYVVLPLSLFREMDIAVLNGC